jgi:anion transporter
LDDSIPFSACAKLWRRCTLFTTISGNSHAAYFWGGAMASTRSEPFVRAPVQFGQSGFFTRHRVIKLSRLIGVAVAFMVVLLLPTPDSMTDLAARQTLGRDAVRDSLSSHLFGSEYEHVEYWQAQAVRVFDHSARSGRTSFEGLERYDLKTLSSAEIEMERQVYEKFRGWLAAQDPSRVTQLLENTVAWRSVPLEAAGLSEKQNERVAQEAWHIKIGVALTVFVVLSFVTEAMPFPAVAFTIGLVLVFTGVVGREEVAGLFWSDASWFIMGSLMMAAALIKTGLDKRISLAVFRRLPFPSIWGVTAWLILIIAPAAMFLSGHVIAAIFLPIGMMLYQNSLTRGVKQDPELAKLLMITIAMACNIGGFGAPSGGARNIIIMNYLEDMYGYTIGYGQWMLYAVPFVVVMMLVVWLLVNLAFKPKVRNLSPALTTLRHDIDRMGRWTKRQMFTLAVFLLVIFAWITEKTLLADLFGFSLGIGVIAVAGSMIYLVSGVVTWRDYQEKVDWGVIWLYAGAIVFGHVLDQTGAAYWMAHALVRGLEVTGLTGGVGVIGTGSLITGALTNVLADGPTAAAVGPVTIKMAAVAKDGINLVPIMGLATACASSFAFLLVIGTPPNAIVYSSGHLKPRDFLRIGVPSFVVAYLLLLAFSKWYWPWIGF